MHECAFTKSDLRLFPHLALLSIVPLPSMNRFDKPRCIVYILDMNKRTSLCLLLTFLLVSAPVGALPLATQLSFSKDSPYLGLDPKIGQLIQPVEGSSEAYTAKALAEPYSLDWVEKYVAEDVRFSFVRTFDQVLANLLPQTTWALGKAVRSQEGVAVPFRYGEELRYGTFVWIEVAEGAYALVSITLNP